jgi:hypothetical protein
MNKPRLFASPAAWFITSLVALGVAVGCSSSTSEPPGGNGSNTSCTAGSTLSCTCADGTAGTKKCGDATCTSCAASNGGDGGSSSHVDGGAGTGEGDGGHVNDGAPPSQLYADAAKGSFGWPCAFEGTDPTDCTDPEYPTCFVGGQGSWCTHVCDAGAQCGSPPTSGQCNARGFCK